MNNFQIMQHVHQFLASLTTNVFCEKLIVMNKMIMITKITAGTHRRLAVIAVTLDSHINNR